VASLGASLGPQAARDTTSSDANARGLNICPSLDG
jgi:hypothetical protein